MNTVLKIYFSSKYRVAFILNLLVLILILTHSFYRDIKLEKQYSGDLRNRVVGARLQKDGRIPYFYKWKKADGYRYIDPENNNNFKVSNITASPVFHNLLLPVCDLPQRSISFLWFSFQYLMLVIIAMLFVKLCKNNIQKCIVINFSVLFTCTEAWKALIAAGQLYLFIGLLIAFVIYGLLKSTKKQYLYFAAFSTALLVLIRPTALIIFIPFFIQYTHSYKYLFRSFAFITAYGLFAIINQQEIRLWVSYISALKENVKAHQHLNPSLQINEPLPEIKNLEGFNISETDKFSLQNPIPIYSENGNIFVLLHALSQKRPSILLINTLLVICVVTLISGFIYWKYTNGFYLTNTVILAFVFFMFAEIFSLIHRHQYTTVQWLPILLTGVVAIKKWYEPAMILLAIGLILNIVTNISLLPFIHTIGEFCWIIALLLLVFKNETNNIKWKLP